VNRFVPLALAFVLALALPAAAGDKPKPDVSFSVAGETFTAQQNVRMTGDIDPATQPETVKIHTQRYKKKTDRWKTHDIRRTESDSSGAFSFRHAPLPKGKYRARAEVAETVDHLAGKNRWKKYTVRARRNH